MHTHADRTQETNANAVVQKKGNSKPAVLPLVDKRSEAVAQRKLQETASNSVQVRQLAQLQSRSGNHPSKAAMPTKSLQFQKNKNSGKLLSKGVSCNVVQGVWYTIDGDTKKTPLVDNGDGTYTHSATKNIYKLKPGSTDTVILASASGTAASSHPPMPELGTWTGASTGVKPVTPWGTVSATHKRGAPYLGSKAGDYGNHAMGDTYVEFVKALRSGGKSDATIAKALLNQDASGFTTDGEKRGAAMFHSTVNLSEEWRKHGASKICRGELRMIMAGDATFDTFLTDFGFVESADDGRHQVARMHEVQYGYSTQGDLPPRDKAIYAALSPPQPGDFSSDDEERGRKNAAVKKNRVFTRYKPSDSDSDSDSG